MKKLTVTAVTCSLFLLLIFAGTHAVSAQNKMDRIERQTMKTMLSAIKDDIKDNYYDENFKGIDIDARFEAAKKRLEEVETTGEALGVIAQALLDFDDSHLFFLPPATTARVEYGWRMHMIGDKCLVTTVKPKSDAEKKGLAPGDQILSVEGFRPNRKDLWKMRYYYNTLSKRTNLTVDVLKPGAEKPVRMTIDSEIEQGPRVITRNLFYKLIDQNGDLATDEHLILRTGDIAIWKMPTFSFEPHHVDTLVDKLGDAKSLILDLRGNSGGYVVTLERLVGYMFDRDLKIAELKGRKKMDPQEAKTKGDASFKGKLIVLIDSRSASAAEIFARLIQLEERGVVLGDVSAGAVMQSRSEINSIRNDSIFYGASITNADVIMSDGKSLEHVGVMPNALLVPTPADMAANRDPVLSEAVKLLGGSMTPEAAGGLFRYNWRSDGSLIVELNKK